MTLDGEQVLLTVDLDTGRTSTEEICPQDVHKFMGGRGIAAKLLYEGLLPRTDPLGPDNLLIFSPGALCGTLAPAASRLTVTSKSPATNRYLKSNAGGHWAAELRHAGYDHILIRGASDRPVFLWIDDDRVELRDASHLWSKRTRETEDAVKADLRDDNIQIAVVGPGAENGVLFAPIIVSRFNTAGRGGIGTVMGAKKLKAIAVRGSGGIPVADAGRFLDLSRTIIREMAADEQSSAWREYGLTRMMGARGRAHLVGAYNFRGSIVEEAELLGGQHMAALGYFRAPLACRSCGVACRHYLKNDSSAYGPLRQGQPEMEPIKALGTQCGITDTDAVLQACVLCDDLGLDVLSAGFTIAWAMECYEKGLITPQQADGLKLEFGNAEVLLELIGRIARREGPLGDLLANGTQQAAAEVGGDSWKWAIQARGLEQSTPDIRVGQALALGFATNPRGPDHLHAMTKAEFGENAEARGLVKKICGDERYADPHSCEKKAELVRWHEDCQAVSGALGICMLVTAALYTITPERMAMLWSAARGIQIDADELMEAGRRIVTLERCFNVREGADRRNEEHLPWRMMHEPLQEGPNAGRVTSPEQLDLMLDEYYDLHGWDVETGRPTVDVLAALGLEDLCSDLEK